MVGTHRNHSIILHRSMVQRVTYCTGSRLRMAINLRNSEEEELPGIGADPVPANSWERVPTPRVSTTRINMQDHKRD